MAREPLTKTEYDEYMTDFSEGFREGIINEQEYRHALANTLGLNASDIEDEVRRNRPPQ